MNNIQIKIESLNDHYSDQFEERYGNPVAILELNQYYFNALMNIMLELQSEVMNNALLKLEEKSDG